MKSTSHNFKNNAHDAMENDNLQQALSKMKVGFVERRRTAADRLPEFEALRDQARDIKNHTLEHIDFYLERFEERVLEQGGHVHWARDATEACEIISGICKNLDAKMVTKGKSMVAEEIGLNDALERDGLEVVETDLGEYIIQLRKEAPSHIIAPAIHVLKEQVASDFRQHHVGLSADRSLEEPEELIHEARSVLRQKYLDSDVGITGANFLIAETGTSVIVTNEGNGDLTQTLPKAHVVIASLEKIVPNLEDATSLLRVLARSATGQEFSSYTTFSSGPKRADDPDGPGEYHVVLLDNGRSKMLGSEFQEMLRCIRCGACMNHCPVYGAIGGHAYGWVYPGPMGAVLTPSFIGVEEAGDLPNASTFCGRCEAVCPVRIPLPKMMRKLREKQFEAGHAPKAARFGLSIWASLASRPRIYQFMIGCTAKFLAALGGKQGRISALPFASGWTEHRELPAPQGKTFQQMWQDQKGRREMGDQK